jgi:hypothetical protein
MATISVRKLDANWEPQYGNGQSDFITDIDAVAQIIKQKLLLFQGEWVLDRTAGTPMFQSILGASRSIDAVVAILKAVILSAPYVTDVINVATNYNSQARTFAFACVAQTPFGPITVNTAQ